MNCIGMIVRLRAGDVSAPVRLLEAVPLVSRIPLLGLDLCASDNVSFCFIPPRDIMVKNCLRSYYEQSTTSPRH